MKIGDKIPEMLGVDANGKEVKRIRLCRKASCHLFLSERQHSRLHRRGMQPARRLRRPPQRRI